jgi:hypothetical protein
MANGGRFIPSFPIGQAAPTQWKRREAVGRGGNRMKSILDPTFRYVPSVETDLRKTFARVRRELRGGAARSNVDVPTAPNVLSLQRRNVAPAVSR